MKLASIVNEYFDRFMDKYGKTALPGHLNALDAITRCRTPASGQLFVKCPECGETESRFSSCGHRLCPQCQNHETSRWVDRQQAKLLPVHYYMVTFTLPFELRPLAWMNQRKVYAILFSCASGTLSDFGLNPDKLGAEMGMTMVLHTHSRRLDFHPHVHAVVPGGGIRKLRRQWIKKRGRYLFNHKALAKVFRARVIDALNQAGLQIPSGVPDKWVVDCTRAGNGINAVKYLARYLYRGIISEKNIISNQNGIVKFRYTESKTGETKYRSLPGEDFLQLIVQHVLPRGFRRVRDYGFLHSNSKRLLSLVQLVLHVTIENAEARPRPAFKCPCCKSDMVVIGFRSHGWESG